MSERGLRAGHRRIAAVIAMGALALGATSACTSHSQAGSAAFVGSTRFTTADVSNAVNGVSLPNVSHATLQQEYVRNLVYVQVLRDYAATSHGTLAEPTADTLSGFATGYHSTPNDPFVLAAARAQSYTISLAATATPATPTDGQLRPMFDRAVAANLADPSGYAQFKTQITAVPEFTRTFGLEQALEKSEAADHVSISPRYALACTSAPCPGFQYSMLPLGNGQGQAFDSVVLPLTPAVAAPAVVDSPAPAAGS